jgi:DNA-binding CsgD family transcriptional regulator
MNTPYLVLTRMRILTTPPPTQWCERRMAVLTRREREVARYAASGLSDVEIAQLLVIEAGTIDTHLRNASSKLSVKTRSQLGMLSICAGILTEDDVLSIWRRYRPETLGGGTASPIHWMRSRVSGLTLRERDVVRYAACGLRNGEIARVLGIGVRGVRFPLYSAFNRLGALSRSQLGMLTILTGILTPDEVLSIWRQHKPEMFDGDGGSHGVLHS